ncbi:ABC transporter substrate-binding protein [Nonomuraea sp. NPDC050310]|uniref:ABC transporter substrate-binding protein n=1 Tax=Nonomuraea sp. NPDC050310 TaxID=3154935 RepID=UPI0033E31ED4
MIRRTLPLAGLALALTACAGVPQQQQAQQQAQQPAALDLKYTTPAASKGLDEIKWNLPYEPATLDAVRASNYAENTALANQCESLLRMTPEMKSEPGLAEKADNPDPTTWVYTLRAGVKFWNGKEVTAEDVAASLNRNLVPENGTLWGAYYTHVESIKATGPLQVTVKLKQPDVLFNQAMATPAGVVMEKAFLDAAGKDVGTAAKGVMCTGPFKLESWKSGESMTLVRNEDYWGAKAKSAKLRFSFIADETTAVNALRAGEVDGQYFYLPPAAVGQLIDSPTGSVTLGQSLVFWALLGAAKEGPYADPRVREALSLALDRAAIAKVVLQNTSQPQRAMVGPAYWTYAEDAFKQAYEALPAEKQDLARAKQLLTEAGSPTEPITIAVQGSSSVHEQTANLIKASGEALGLKIELKVVPVDQYGNLYGADPKAREGIDAFFSTWYGNLPDPLDVYSVFTDGARTNFNGFQGVSADLAKARAEYDDQARAGLITGIQEKVTRGVAWTPMTNLSVVLYMNDRITGAVPSFAFLYAPWAVELGAK